MTAAELAARLDARRNGNAWMALCPAHDDHNPSLSITENAGGRVLVKCRAGCSQRAVIEALRSLGLWSGERHELDSTDAAGRARVQVSSAARAKEKKTHATLDGARRAACWSVEQSTGYKWTATRQDFYRDAEGKDFMAVIRFEREDGARKPDGKAIKEPRPIHAVEGGWKVGRPTGKCLLFKLPELRASAGAVFVVEGEKAACAGADIGLTCTTWPFGAEGISKADFSPLAVRDVTLLPDNDSPGRKSMQGVASILAALNPPARIRIVELPGLPPKGDLADFIALRAGQSPESIRGEVEQLASAAPTWTPAKRETPTVPPVSAASLLTADAEGIRARLWEIAQEKSGATECYRKQAAKVIEWLHGRGRFFYSTARRDFAGVMFFDCDRKLLLPVQGDAFLAWLADNLAMNRAERSFAFVVAAVETEGLSERATGIEPATYWAAREGALYVSNGPGNMIRISADRLALVDNGTDGVLFPFGSTLEPWTLTTPRDPFETCALFRDMSAAAPHGRTLFKLFVCALPSDQRTKPQLCVSGVIGSGKTKLVTGIFELYGIPARVSAIHKHGEDDFWVAMEAGGFTCFDNADTSVGWLADALAAASTGGSLEKRELYTNAGRVTLRPRSWVAVTSASPTFAADAGLADRLLVIRLNRRQGDTAETALSDEVRRNRDAGLSWICTTLSKALGDRAPVPTGLNARHPDFATLAVRIGRAMGAEAEAAGAMRAAETDKGLFNLENDDIGAALLELMQAGAFTGNAGTLLERLKEVEPSFDGRLSDKRLGKRLAKLWPHLESVLTARQERDGHTRTWVYSFRPPSVAGFAGFGDAHSEKSPCGKSIGSLQEAPSETPQTQRTVLDFTAGPPPEPKIEEGEI
jgi:hypothetical protein